jgi:hypothetical protein
MRPITISLANIKARIDSAHYFRPLSLYRFQTDHKTCWIGEKPKETIANRVVRENRANQARKKQPALYWACGIEEYSSSRVSVFASSNKITSQLLLGRPNDRERPGNYCFFFSLKKIQRPSHINSIPMKSSHQTY